MYGHGSKRVPTEHHDCAKIIARTTIQREKQGCPFKYLTTNELVDYLRNKQIHEHGMYLGMYILNIVNKLKIDIHTMHNCRY